jgi:hypothetical protein
MTMVVIGWRISWRSADQIGSNWNQPSCVGHRSAAIFRRGAFVAVELPEFLICALEQRVVEANAGALSEEVSTLNQYIESELANLITVRDVAELEANVPGFGAAVQHWLNQIATWGEILLAGNVMSRELLTIVAAVAGGLMTLVTGWLVAIATSRREREAFLRDLQRNRVERLRTLFEDGLVMFERHERNLGKSSEEHVTDMLRVKARLTLGASKDIAEQFQKTAIALDEWAIEARQGAPKQLAGGVTLISAGTGEEKHREAAARLWPIFDAERQKLLDAMRAELHKAETMLWTCDRRPNSR